MYPSKFDYVRVQSVEEAVRVLGEHGEEARVLAGGHSLIPLMKLRVLRPKYLIDIGGIQGLKYIRRDKNTLRIGALTTYFELENSLEVSRTHQVIASGASVVGDPQVRNWGTIGGSLSHCDPSGDMGSCVLAARGLMHVRGPSETRTVESDNWFVDTFQSALRQGEILEEIEFQVPPGKLGGAYLKLERKSGDYAIVGVAVSLALDSSGKCSYAGIGLTSVGATNLRAKNAENAILGKIPTKEVISEASEEAFKEVTPSDDPLRGSAEYKKEMVRVYVRRGLEKALEAARSS